MVEDGETPGENPNTSLNEVQIAELRAAPSTVCRW
jgi:hypothetical protein